MAGEENALSDMKMNENNVLTFRDRNISKVNLDGERKKENYWDERKRVKKKYMW